MGVWNLFLFIRPLWLLREKKNSVFYWQFFVNVSRTELIFMQPSPRSARRKQNKVLKDLTNRANEIRVILQSSIETLFKCISMFEKEKSSQSLPREGEKWGYSAAFLLVWPWLCLSRNDNYKQLVMQHFSLPFSLPPVCVFELEMNRNCTNVLLFFFVLFFYRTRVSQADSL